MMYTQEDLMLYLTHIVNNMQGMSRHRLEDALQKAYDMTISVQQDAPTLNDQDIVYVDPLYRMGQLTDGSWVYIDDLHRLPRSLLDT